MSDQKTEATKGSESAVERVVSCRWWQRHIDTRWEDFATAETTRGKPVLIQEKRCTVCNRAKRRLVQID